MDYSWSVLAPYDALVRTDKIEPRAYQINIIKGMTSGKNTLVVLPTGLGKTLIAVFAIAKALKEGKKAIILAPTRPLSEQHHKSLNTLLNIDPDKITLFTGSLASSKRQQAAKDSLVIAATPQTIANDLKAERINLDDFGVVVFDECHRAAGKYAYTYIADECVEKGVQLVGLTASPGSKREKVDEIIDTLKIQNIEIRISTDPDVAPYVMGKEVSTIFVEKGPEIDKILAVLRPVIDEHMSKLYQYGLSYSPNMDKVPKGRLLEIGNNIKKLQAQGYKYMAMFNYVYVLDLVHAYDLLQSEGIHPFLVYFESLMGREKKSKAVNNILSNPRVMEAIKIAKEADAQGIEHPKMFAIIDYLKNTFKGKSVIVFAQYRATTRKLASLLNEHGISAKVFVGKKEGVTQQHQQKIIEEFRNSEFKVLCATSIAEEGLDIPSVDLVVFYEPVPSEIRNIQRKGRAGRMKFGEVVIMVARGTRDEAYLMIARAREKKMRDIVSKIQEQLARGTYTSKAPAKQAML